MIFDIDDKTSVKQAIELITRDWFDANQVYWNLHSKKITNSPYFLTVKDYFFQSISDYLSLSSEEFIREWNIRCINTELYIMGYHCTRLPNSQLISKKGIIPLSNKVLSNFFSESTLAFPNLKISEEQLRAIRNKIIETDIWKHRTSKTPGPNFFLSYRDAQIEGKGYQEKGPEIWWICVDIFFQYCEEFEIMLPCKQRELWIEKIVQGSKPHIFHCQIPYSILPNQSYFAFCILRSFFKFIDPDDYVSEVPIIDFGGYSLDPKYITKTEDL